MKCRITLISFLFGIISAVPIARQLGGLSSDVHILTVNGTDMCQIDGRLYHIDDDLPTEDPCEYCTCQPPGFACQVVKCDHKPECRALQRSGLCCPEYVCDCEFNDQIYQNGDRITDNDNKCEDCYCVTGEVICSVIQCAAPPENCELIPAVNRCCPSYHCPDKSDDRNEESTKLENIWENETIVEVSKINEKSETVTPPNDEFAKNYITTEKMEIATEKSQVDLDGKENEYWPSILNDGSVDLKVKDLTNIDNTQYLISNQISHPEEIESTVIEEPINNENFNEMTKHPESELEEFNSPLNEVTIDSVRINVEEGMEVHTEALPDTDYHWVTGFDVEEFDMSTMVSVVKSEEVNERSKINLDLVEALKSQNEEAESIDVVTEVSETRIQNGDGFEATERNVDELRTPLFNQGNEIDVTDKVTNANFKEEEIIESHDVNQDASIVTNEETVTLIESPSKLGSLHDKEVEATERSTEEDISMSTSHPEHESEVVNKAEEIQFTIDDVLKLQDETVIKESEIEKLNEFVPFSNDKMEFEATERSVEELSTLTSHPGNESAYVNKNNAEFVLSLQNNLPDSFEMTTIGTETRIGGSITELKKTDQFEVTERNDDEQSLSTIYSVQEPDIVKQQNEITESLDVIETKDVDFNELESFNSDIEEFKATERNVDDFSMTTHYPYVKKNQDPESSDAVTDEVGKRIESLDKLESLDTTERAVDEELSITSNTFPKQEDIVIKAAKTNIDNKEHLSFHSSFHSSNRDSIDMTTEILKSRTQSNDGIESLSNIDATTEHFETRTEKFIELDNEVLEFGIKDVRDKSESFTTLKSVLDDSGEVKKLAKINVAQLISPHSPVTESEEIMIEISENMTIRVEPNTSNDELKYEESTSMTETPMENKVDDKFSYWINMANSNEQPIQGNELTENDNSESTTIKIEDNFLVKENEKKISQNSIIKTPTELERDIEAVTTELTETEIRNEESVTEPSFNSKNETHETVNENVTEVVEVVIHYEVLPPKKQRMELHQHLSKKFGLRPLTRRTFSNDIEERRKTRLRDRKMIVNRNRQNLFH